MCLLPSNTPLFKDKFPLFLYFFFQGRVPFQVPDNIPWSKMAEVLKTKFKAETGCELTSENLQFLGWKVLRSKEVDYLNLDGLLNSMLCS